MTEYEPGTVAVVTYCGQHRRAILNDYHGALTWFFAAPVYNVQGAGPASITDVRPLVVVPIEVEGSDKSLTFWLQRATKALHEDGHLTFGNVLSELVTQIEAQTRPPKPPEPTGIGAVVKDREGNQWTRIYAGIGEGEAWYCDCPLQRDPRDDNQWKHYADIDAVEVLSEGVTTNA